MARRIPGYVAEESVYAGVAGTDEEGQKQHIITLI